MPATTSKSRKGHKHGEKMSFAKNLTSTELFGTSEELSYQLSELQYHLENIQASMQEVFYHMQRSKYHMRLVQEELNKQNIT